MCHDISRGGAILIRGTPAEFPENPQIVSQDFVFGREVLRIPASTPVASPGPARAQLLICVNDSVFRPDKALASLRSPRVQRLI